MDPFKPTEETNLGMRVRLLRNRMRTTAVGCTWSGAVRPPAASVRPKGEGGEGKYCLSWIFVTVGRAGGVVHKNNEARARWDAACCPCWAEHMGDTFVCPRLPFDDRSFFVGNNTAKTCRVGDLFSPSVSQQKL